MGVEVAVEMALAQELRARIAGPHGEFALTS
jgi:hypothetical protein